MKRGATRAPRSLNTLPSDRADDPVRDVVLIDGGDVFGGESEVESTHRVIEIFCLRRAYDRRGDSLCEMPRERHLGHGRGMLFGDFADARGVRAFLNKEYKCVS